MPEEQDTVKLSDEMTNVIKFIAANPRMETISDLVTSYIKTYPDKFTAQDLINLSIDLSTRFLSPRIDTLVHNEKIINEYATYINMYLSGKMFKTEEAAKRNLQPQINNSQKIIDLTSKQKED